MGIKGLHKALSFCTVKDNLRNHRNSIIAVDTSSWMHKSVYSASEKFVEATNNGRVDHGCVRVSARYIITRCKELIEAFGIKAVYLVMDGKRIPLKAEESQDRDQKRLQNLAEARRLKRAGQRWKAEDKYKSCIRIKDNFTEAVIREVEKAFSNYGRVFFVNSPHEADSQLTRLVLDGVADAVITEDSDVLVYSAAAHKPFPILFKLDRRTGACDSINMKWLISPSSQETARAVTSKNTLEFILRRFASKQVNTKGLGVRLFVQGCILSGCDYRKNIEGIGTTNAFKLVSENAFRGASVRFRKILESLPKKVRQKIEINEHEEILAKSEAIFFYHPVLHKDCQIKPLLEPRISPEESSVGKCHSDHYPCMSRFKGDWSFLGNIDSSSSRVIPNSYDANNCNTVQKSMAPSILSKPNSMSSTLPTKNPDFSHSSASNRSQTLQNPYKKFKICDNNRQRPLGERNINIRFNTEKKLETQKNMGTGSITKFLVKPDPRYAKRTFSSTTVTKRDTQCSRLRNFSVAGSSFQLSSRSNASQKPPGQSFFEKRATKKTHHTTSSKTTNSRIEQRRFDYSPIESNGKKEISFSYPSCNLPSPSECESIRTKRASSDIKRDGLKNLDRNLQDFFDLTNSNSSDMDNSEIRTKIAETKMEATLCDDQAVSVVPSNDTFEETEKESNAIGVKICSTFTSEEPNDNERDHTKNAGKATSKYFSKKRSDPRRVTLDSSIRRPCDGLPSVACTTPVRPQSIDDEMNLPATRKNELRDYEWALDECIDDPEEEVQVAKPKSGFESGSFANKCKIRHPLPQENSNKSCSESKGSIRSFFKRQEIFANQLKRSIEPNKRSQPKRSKPNDFFSPDRYSKKKKSNNNSSHRFKQNPSTDILSKTKRFALSQLDLKGGQSQSSDDYLWNGTP
ncbi:unnamed protein product [Pseudo-nitzschia multistriata]|uniref:XPG N-terminal domain-containing protein n=1 Tax=Pseudo-nitzschia multistriata TaxID=183589 RepID=A0A448ZCR9_9STRA|nr:unnamed protein product [Pseudo-nitzschia multistriata]